MEFKVKRDDLFNVLTKARKYLSKTVPALGNFLFEVDSNTHWITVTASDSQSTFRTRVAGVVAVSGKYILSEKMLYGALKNFESHQVAFTMDPKKSEVLVAKCKKQKVNIPVQDASSFVQVPKYKADETLRILSEDLQALIKGTTFAKLKNPSAASDYKFEGVNIKIKAGQATFICSDKNRVALGRYKFQNAIDAEFTFSGKSLEDFVNGLSTGQTIEIKWDKTADKVYIEAGDMTLYPALYAEKYPDVARYIPTANSTIVIKREKLINSLEIANLVDSKIELKAVGQELKLANQASGTSSAFSESISATVSNDATINLRGNYFLDGLKAMAEDEVELLIENERKPVVIRPKQQADYAYILLPVV